MARQIEIDGQKYQVVESLGYQHGVGGYAMVVLVDGKEKTAVKQNRLWRFWTPADRVAPLLDAVKRGWPEKKDMRPVGRPTAPVAAPSLLPYQDPNHSGNSTEHHTGKLCIEKGCGKPAGTKWSPLWCFAHNVERMDRISANFDKIRF